MTNNISDLRSEIEALRRELAAMRAEQAPGGKSSTPPEPETESSAANFADQLRTLAREVSTFAEETEKGVVEHPLPSVLGALLLGILIGRVLPR